MARRETVEIDCDICGANITPPYAKLEVSYIGPGRRNLRRFELCDACVRTLASTLNTTIVPSVDDEPDLNG